MTSEDRRVVACNYGVATSACSAGALCFVRVVYWGEPARVLISARSRGGRWIDKVERIDRLKNFRHKTLCAENPKYQDHALATHYSEERVTALNGMADIARQQREAKAA